MTDRTLTPLTVQHAQAELPFRADRVAIDDSNRLQLLSCVGSGVSVRALAAALRSQAAVQFYARQVHYEPSSPAEKYRFRYAKLGLDTWHLLAVAHTPRLLIELNDDSLWDLLSSDEFTTPIMRHWMPWVMVSLVNGTRSMRELPYCHNCRPWMCVAKDELLDQVVRFGLQNGHLKLEDISP